MAVAAVALLVLAAGLLPASAETTVPAAQSTGIPAASMGCAPGQVDINTATVAALTGKPGIASREVTARVVAAAPFASLQHLLAVPGIGPGGLAKIEAAGWACLRIPAPTPPVFDLCRGQADDVDLNTVGVAEAADLFGRPTAERLAAMQAHPMWKVEHAIALAGIGPGRVSQYGRRLCVTPPTLHDIAGGVSWTWSSRRAAVTARSTDGAAALTVLAGAVAADVWVRMEDLVVSGRIGTSPEWSAVLESSFPAAQYAPRGYDSDLVQPDGTQLQPTSPVRVTLPIDGDLSAAPDLTPIVRHWDDGFHDWEVYKGRAEVDRTAGTVSAWVPHLSPSIASFGVIVPIVIFPDDGSSQTNENSMLDVIRHTTQPGNADDRACDGLDPHHTDARRGDALVERTSNDGAFSYCTNYDGNYATWKIRNTRGGPVKVSIDSPYGWVRADGTSADEALTRALLDHTGTKTGVWTQGGVWLAPDDVATVQLRHHTTATITVDGQAGPVWAYAASLAIADTLGASSNEQANEMYFIAKCAYADDMFGCLAGAQIERELEELAKRGLIRYIGKVAAKRLLVAYTAFKVLHPLSALPSETMRVQFNRPDRPTLDARRRTIPANCVGAWSDATWSWPVNTACVDTANPVPDDQPHDGGTGQPATAQYMIKRVGTPASYVVDDQHVAHHIPDGGTYLCDAARLPVRYNVDDTEWATLVTTEGAPATCLTTPTRGLYPDTVHNFLLRTADGDTYFVGTDGYRIPLFSGDDVWQCMTNKYLVWDQVTSTELERFQPHPSTIATGCGVATP